MKISPVAGTPTINQPSTTGLAPDKLARIKGIATGQPVEQAEEDKSKLLAATQNKIVMNVNRTPGGTEIGDADGAVEGALEETVKTDAIVQANEGSEVTQPLSPQLAALARQRRALQVKEREIAEREKALDGGQTLTAYKAKLKGNLLGTLLEDVGPQVYDQLTQEILGQKANNDPRVEKLEAEIAELKGGVDKRFTAAEEAQEASAINYVADKLDALVATGDDYDLLKAADGEEEVIRRVYNHWKKTGKELDVATVAKEYQEELAEEATRYAKLKQVQARLAPAEPLQPQATPQTGIRTLTNKDSARPVMDRRQRAILAAQGQLKR